MSFGQMMSEHDPVNHPEHYQMRGGLEVIDIIRAVVASVNDPYEAYSIGNILKYCCRYRKKGGVESLKKARWYLTAMIEYMEERDRTYGTYTRKDVLREVAEEVAKND